MSYEAALAVLQTNSIGFSTADTFNDPFELVSGYPVVGDNLFQKMTSAMKNFGKKELWSYTSGILCLTRNPLNPLMWAHYAKDHRGVVIGIDMLKSGLLDIQACLIPAQFGSVIYTSTRPIYSLFDTKDFNVKEIGRMHHFDPSYLEKLQRLFLYKPSCWAYEEEVRVVKCLRDRNEEGVNHSGRFSDVFLSNKMSYAFKLPKDSITEIYFGLRHEFSSEKSEKNQSLIQEFMASYPTIRAKRCHLSTDAWEIEARDID